jgi:hypothetical protein
MLKPGACVGKHNPPQRALFQQVSLRHVHGRLTSAALATPKTGACF